MQKNTYKYIGEPKQHKRIIMLNSYAELSDTEFKTQYFVTVGYVKDQKFVNVAYEISSEQFSRLFAKYGKRFNAPKVSIFDPSDMFKLQNLVFTWERKA